MWVFVCRLDFIFDVWYKVSHVMSTTSAFAITEVDYCTIAETTCLVSLLPNLKTTRIINSASRNAENA